MSHPGLENIPDNSPEQAGLIDHAARLRELLHVDENIMTELRPELWSKANKLAGSLVDPARQQVIKLYADVLDWQMFGQPGDPLPQGLQLFQEGDKRTIAHDTSIPYLTSNIPLIISSELSHIGLDEVGKAIQQQLYENEPEIRATLTDFLHQSAEYQLLSSFGRPECRAQPQPLNDYWRQVRYSQAESDVANLFGYETGESIMADGGASYELNRLKYHIDDETELSPNRSARSQDGLSSAKEYLLPYLFAATSGSKQQELLSPPRVYHDEESEELILTYQTPASTFETNLSYLLEPAGRLLSSKLYSGPSDMRFISELFSDMAIEQIFDPWTQSIEEAVASAIDRTINMVYYHIGRSLHATSQFEYPGAIDILLRAPTSDIIFNGPPPRPTIDYKAWEGFFNKVASYASFRDLSTRHHIVKGFVREYSPENFRTASRIILQAQCQLQSSEQQTDCNEDLVLDLIEFDNKFEPLVPGYTLVSKTEPDRYGFVVDDNGDPYSRCEVPIEGPLFAELIEEYRAIGLRSLADNLESHPNLTVGTFEQLVKSYSTYYIPDVAKAKNPAHVPLFPSAMNTLDEFADSVHDEKLSVQCTASGLFLQRSLDKLFGSGSTGQVSGLVMSSGDSLIRANRHMQTIFTHDGTQYILDATPAYDFGDRPKPLPPASGLQVERQTASAPKISPEPRPSKSETSSTPTKSPEEQLADLMTSFLEQGKVAFRLSNDRLLGEFLVKLPVQDPARRTFELLSRYSSGRINADQLSEQADYVAKCPRLPQNIRQALKIDHYSIAFLEQLRLTVERLQLIRQS